MTRMLTLLDICRLQTAREQSCLRDQIRFIESGDQLTPPHGELAYLRMRLAEHDALVAQYAHLP